MVELPIIVREKKVTLFIGILNVGIFSFMLIGAVMVWIRDYDNVTLMLGLGFLFFWVMGFYAILEYFRHKIIIDAENVTYISSLGKIKVIKIEDIGNITYPYSGVVKMCKIFDKSGVLRISFELIMVNSFEALEYLNEATGLNKPKDDEDEDATEDTKDEATV